MAEDISGLIHLRRMNEEDIEAVLVIESGLAGRKWTRQSFRESLQRPEAHFYVAEEAGRQLVCGYCCCYSVLGEAEIVNVAVDPAKRKLGIGWRMIREALETEEREGISSFVLEVRRSNLAAQRLYEKAGFTACGIRRRFYENPVEDAIVMVLQTGDQK